MSHITHQPVYYRNLLNNLQEGLFFNDKNKFKTTIVTHKYRPGRYHPMELDIDIEFTGNLIGKSYHDDMYNTEYKNNWEIKVNKIQIDVGDGARRSGKEKMRLEELGGPLTQQELIAIKEKLLDPNSDLNKAAIAALDELLAASLAPTGPTGPTS